MDTSRRFGALALVASSGQCNFLLTLQHDHPSRAVPGTATGRRVRSAARPRTAGPKRGIPPDAAARLASSGAAQADVEVASGGVVGIAVLGHEGDGGGIPGAAPEHPA